MVGLPISRLVVSSCPRPARDPAASRASASSTLMNEEEDGMEEGDAC